MDPKERDSYEIGLLTMGALGQVNPLHLCPMFAIVELTQPNLHPLLQDIPEETRNKIILAMQQNHEENSSRVQYWWSKADPTFRTYYSTSAELINGATENLGCYGKFVGAHTVKSSSAGLVALSILRTSKPMEEW